MHEDDQQHGAAADDVDPVESTRGGHPPILEGVRDETNPHESTTAICGMCVLLPSPTNYHVQNL